MPQIVYIYNTGTDDSCPECLQWDGEIGTEDELPATPNPDCLNGQCKCYREEYDPGGDDCEQQGLVDCEDSEGFPFCGEPQEEGCGQDGCWCILGLDPQSGDETECSSPYWDPDCICADECDERDE